MKTRIELIISLENEVDLCFEAKKTCDNDGPPYPNAMHNQGRLARRMFSRKHGTHTNGDGLDCAVTIPTWCRVRAVSFGPTNYEQCLHSECDE